MKPKVKIHLLIIAVLFLATRINFLLSPAGRFGDADQAVFGMMAQEIAALREFPIYIWEAHYAGAPVSYIASVIFHFFGSGFIQLRSAMLLIIFPAYLLFYFIYRRLAGNQAAFAGALFLVFCPFLVLDCTTAAYGGYGESFLGLAMLILISWRITEAAKEDSRGFHFFIMGLTSGFLFIFNFM